MDTDTIVIGGGLAGLTAAATLAAAGEPVTLLEASGRLGGRARSRNRHGFVLNEGPHALYVAGGAAAILRRLGVRLRGHRPRLWRAGFYVGGTVVPAQRYLSGALHDRVATMRASIGCGRARARRLAGRPTDTWIDESADDQASRDVLASLLRTATYTADFGLSDAGATTRQLRLGARGVLYLDGGWQSMVDGLEEILAGQGVDIRLGAKVSAVHHDRCVRAVELDDGNALAAHRVVVAVNDPRRAAALLEGPGAAPVAAAAAATMPVRMAHLDVAVRPLPCDRPPNIFGLDRPVYVSVTSDVAAVAPTDGAVITVGRYLRPDEEDGDHRAELEAALDAAQPGWADHAIDVRYTPRSMVAGDHPRVATRGSMGRADVAVAEVAGLAVAGDWIGPSGLLADAAVRSGRAAALHVLETRGA